MYRVYLGLAFCVIQAEYGIVLDLSSIKLLFQKYKNYIEILKQYH